MDDERPGGAIPEVADSTLPSSTEQSGLASAPSNLRFPRRRVLAAWAAVAVSALFVGWVVGRADGEPVARDVQRHPGGNQDPAPPGTIVADTPPTTLDPQDAASVRVAERFIAARNAGDVATATSLLGDRVTVALMNDYQMAGNMPSVELTRDELVLALDAERLYDVRYEPFVCHDSVWARLGGGVDVTCTSSMDSRLRRIEGLPPIESSVTVSLADGLVRGVSLPWLSISVPGYRPAEIGNFVRWLDALHPDAHPPLTEPQPDEPFGPFQLFYWEGQELVHIFSREKVDLLARYLDEYEQLRATGAGSSSARRDALDSAAQSPVGDVGVFEPIRGWIVFPDGEGGIAAVDPDNPSSLRTVLANPEGMGESVRPTGWSPDGTQLALDDQDHSGSWIMDSSGALTNVTPRGGCCVAVRDSPWTPDTLKGVGSALWRYIGPAGLDGESDGATYLIPYLVAKWATVESDPARKWEISFIVSHSALSGDGEQLLLTAADGPAEWERVAEWKREWGFADLASAPGLYVLRLYPGAGRSLDGSSLRRIAAGNYMAAAWSPDGTQIAAITGHTLHPEEDRAIVVMNADGTDKHALIELAPGPTSFMTGIAWHPLAPSD